MAEENSLWDKTGKMMENDREVTEKVIGNMIEIEGGIWRGNGYGDRAMLAKSEVV